MKKLLSTVFAIALVFPSVAFADLETQCKAEAEVTPEGQLPASKADFIAFCECMGSKAAGNAAMNAEAETLGKIGDPVQIEATQSDEMKAAVAECQTW